MHVFDGKENPILTLNNEFVVVGMGGQRIKHPFFKDLLCVFIS